MTETAGSVSETKVNRYSFLMHLRPDRIEQYLNAHAEVWPEMLDALRDAGWSNYSLFLRPDDGLIVGYVETDNFERASAAMARLEVNTRWQSLMSEFFADASRPDASVEVLTEYFHLD